MENSDLSKPAVWFWVVSALALIWNLMGVGAFFVQVTATAGPETAAAATPLWYVFAFAIAVFGAVFGCIALLLRRHWAGHFFAASLVGIAFQQIYHFILTDIGKTLGTADLVMTIMIPVVGALLFWLAQSAAHRGWLR